MINKKNKCNEKNWNYKKIEILKKDKLQRFSQSVCKDMKIRVSYFPFIFSDELAEGIQEIFNSLYRKTVSIKDTIFFLKNAQ